MVKEMDLVIETTTIAIPRDDYDKKLANLVKHLLDLEKTTLLTIDRTETQEPIFTKGAA